MATDTKPACDASVTELVSGIISNSQDLMLQQFNLLKCDVLAELRKTREAGLLLSIGGGLCAIAGILFMLMLVYLLNWAFPTIPLWGCYAIVCGLALVVGLGLVLAAKKKFAEITPIPERSIQAFKENVRWITNPNPNPNPK